MLFDKPGSCKTLNILKPKLYVNVLMVFSILLTTLPTNFQTKKTTISIYHICK